MSIEAGKKYKRRDGSIAVTHKPAMGSGFIVESGGTAYFVDEYGRYSSGCRSHQDLIAERTTEPRVWTETITVFDGGSGSPCQTLGAVCEPIRILARKTVTITEGEGL